MGETQRRPVDSDSPSEGQRPNYASEQVAEVGNKTGCYTQKIAVGNYHKFPWPCVLGPSQDKSENSSLIKVEVNLDREM